MNFFLSSYKDDGTLNMILDTHIHINHTYTHKYTLCQMNIIIIIWKINHDHGIKLGKKQVTATTAAEFS